MAIKWTDFIDEKENVMDAIMMITTIGYLILSPLRYMAAATHVGAFAVLFAWIKITMLIGRFPTFGVYILMSTYVFTTLVLFFVLYLTTMIGFAFAFHMLLPGLNAFRSPIQSFLKVIVMMIGEFEFEDNFTFKQNNEVNNNRATSADGSVQIIFFLFILLVSIILANLIVGLTVNKTEELFERADHYQNIKEVKQIRSLETIILNIKRIVGFFEDALSRDWLFGDYLGWNGAQLLPYLRRMLANDKCASDATKKELIENHHWDVCVCPNNESRRIRQWYKRFTHAQSTNAAASDFLLYFYDKQNRILLNETGFYLTYDVVQDALKRTMELREESFLS